MSSILPVVLLPTYNERGSLESVVESVLRVATTDILIIDDNSPDGTGELADELAQTHEQVFVLHRARKEGLGKAYVSGFQWALARHYTHILQMDADLSHPPEVIPNMLDLTAHYDLVLGSRWVSGGGTVNWSQLREWISKCGSFYAKYPRYLNSRRNRGIQMYPSRSTGKHQIKMSYNLQGMCFKSR